MMTRIRAVVMGTMIGVGLTSGVLGALGAGTSPCAGSPTPLGDRAVAEPEKIQSELQADLAVIAEQNAAFFDDPWLRIGGTYFGLAQQASKTLVVDGKPSLPSVNQFHNQLDEFLRAIESLPQWEPGTTGWENVRGTKKPSAAATKKVSAAVSKVKATANQFEGFKELALMTLGESTTPEQAAEYGTQMMNKIEGVIYARGLGQITGVARKQTADSIGESVKKLRAALTGLVGGEERTDDKSLPPIEERAAIAKKRIADLRQDFKTLNKVVPWGRDRVALAEEDLGRLDQNLGKLRSPKK